VEARGRETAPGPGNGARPGRVRSQGEGAWPGKARGKGESARGREEEGEERRRERGGAAHLGARRSWQPSTKSHLGQRRSKRGGREREGSCYTGNENEIERGRGAMGARHGSGRVGSRAGPGQKPTARTTTYRKKNANQKPKRDGRAISHNIRQKKYASA
jgi:hypothetical protein